jgi:hypothetical protein
LKKGDRNTEFFHRKATWWAQKIKIIIDRLEKEDGSLNKNKKEMATTTVI